MVTDVSSTVKAAETIPVIQLVQLKPKKNILKKMLKSYELYIFILPALVYFLVFHYGPMYGIQLAFKDFIATNGILGSPWVGMKHFNNFFNGYFFWVIIKNTIFIAFYSLLAGFPIPIILALMLNEVKSTHTRL